MTEAPETTETTPPAPTAADKRPRSARPGKPDKPAVADPDAPYGYMKDPKTGETRPKKAPGRGKTLEAPRSRPSAQARAARSVPSKTTDYRPAVMALLDGVWTLAASVPDVDPGTSVFGFDLRGPVVRVHAQAAVMKDNAQGLVNGLGIMAQHSAPVRTFLTKAGDESGPAWILPAMMALLPFAVQSASMWRADLGDVEALAKRTTTEFDELVKGAMAAQIRAEAESAGMVGPDGHDPSA